MALDQDRFHSLRRSALGQSREGRYGARGVESRLLGHLAVVDVGSEVPQVSFAPPFPIEVEARAADALDTGGEYLAAVFLPDGSIGVVFPIQNYSASRFGFGWRRYVASP